MLQYRLPIAVHIHLHLVVEGNIREFQGLDLIVLALGDGPVYPLHIIPIGEELPLGSAPIDGKLTIRVDKLLEVEFCFFVLLESLLAELKHILSLNIWNEFLPMARV